MKNSTIISSVIIIAMTSVSCTKDSTDIISTKHAITTTAGIENVDVRTSLGWDESDPFVSWTTGDKLCIFDGADKNEFSMVQGEGTAKGTFSGSVSDLSGVALIHNKYMAIYPYSQGVNARFYQYELSETQKYQYKIRDVIIPTEQACKLDSFAEGANFAIGVSSDAKSFTLLNALAYIRINIKGNGISSVKVENTEETPRQLSGGIQINFLDSKIYNNSTCGTAYSYVILKPASGTTLAEGAYYLAVYPQSSGHSKLKIIVEREDGYTAELKYDGEPLRSKANTLLKLPTIDVDKLNWKQNSLSFKLSFMGTDEELKERIQYIGSLTDFDMFKTIANANEDNSFVYHNAYLLNGEQQNVEFSIFGPWAEGARQTSQITMTKTGVYMYYSSDKYPMTPQFMSTPVIPGYKLDKVEVTSSSQERKITLLTSNEVTGTEFLSYLLGNYTTYVTGTTVVPYVNIFENLSTQGTNKSVAGTVYYLANYKSNPRVQSIEYTYVLDL